ncbi:type 2 DNA topoisomerase 6 subunit B-like isoform X2 [Mangifera indica]|uniref:type 2 DNA topoisomerase 6 subunit B-like isoform X2 n=1 Tax=Mangifera indica TaxID=29780 RepID=UPI001CFC188A|nr:type 2 DNA topoisomerase 6 subunit B-like isoform X2 [Mangifera indica]
MEISSVQNLCIHLISAAFQRCRVSEDLCRLSVGLKCCAAHDPSNVLITISDTGIGSCLEELQDLKFSREFVEAKKWDGVLSVKTTNICDDEIHHYHLNLKESISTRRLIRLPSNPKNGVKFSGTEVYLSSSECIDVLLAEFICFFQKILILKIPNVAVELVLKQEDVPGSQHENILLVSECNPLSLSTSFVDRLKSGFKDYVLKSGNSLQRKCESCLPSWEQQKVGGGVACCSESHKSPGLVMEVVIIISELSGARCPCFRACSAKTEVLYFNDFSPCSINQSSLNVLTTIDWKSYGLVLGRVVDQGGNVMLEWENLPPRSHIDMVIHCYHKQLLQFSQKTQPDGKLLKKAIKLALEDLKEKNAGMLLSAHTLKIRSYAPDLARTIAGLILTSNDTEFQEECFSLLGLPYQDNEGELLEECIKEKIISVIEMNDRKPERRKEIAHYLFEDDCLQEPSFDDDGYDKGEHLFSSLDY